METFALIRGHDKVNIEGFTICKGDLIELEKLCSWLDGFQGAKSGHIDGHHELVMLIRHFKETEK